MGHDLDVPHDGRYDHSVEHGVIHHGDLGYSHSGPHLLHYGGNHLGSHVVHHSKHHGYNGHLIPHYGGGYSYQGVSIGFAHNNIGEPIGYKHGGHSVYNGHDVYGGNSVYGGFGGKGFEDKVHHGSGFRGKGFLDDTLGGKTFERHGEKDLYNFQEFGAKGLHEDDEFLGLRINDAYEFGGKGLYDDDVGVKGVGGFEGHGLSGYKNKGIYNTGFEGLRVGGIHDTHFKGFGDKGGLGSIGFGHGDLVGKGIHDVHYGGLRGKKIHGNAYGGLDKVYDHEYRGLGGDKHFLNHKVSFDTIFRNGKTTNRDYDHNIRRGYNFGGGFGYGKKYRR